MNESTEWMNSLSARSVAEFCALILSSQNTKCRCDVRRIHFYSFSWKCFGQSKYMFCLSNTFFWHDVDNTNQLKCLMAGHSRHYSWAANEDYMLLLCKCVKSGIPDSWFQHLRIFLLEDNNLVVHFDICSFSDFSFHEHQHHIHYMNGNIWKM